MAIEEGKAAPQFTLNDADGNTVALKDLKGKHVVVYFYPPGTTPRAATKEACGFRDYWQEIQGRPTRWCSASPRTPKHRTRSSRDKYELPFTLLSDPDRKVMTKYGAYGEKTMYGRKDHGRHPVHRAGRSGRQGRQALAPGRQGGGPPAQGARGC